MWGRTFWGMLGVALVLGGGVKESAEMYLWTDAQGVLHMTNQWAHVPESARAQVAVRDSTPPTSEGMPAMGPAARPAEPDTVGQPPMQLPPDLAQMPSTTAPSPPSMTYSGDSSVLIPSSRPSVHHRRKVSPPF